MVRAKKMSTAKDLKAKDASIMMSDIKDFSVSQIEPSEENL